MIWESWSDGNLGGTFHKLTIREVDNVPSSVVLPAVCVPGADLESPLVREPSRAIEGQPSSRRIRSDRSSGAIDNRQTAIPDDSGSLDGVVRVRQGEAVSLENGVAPTAGRAQRQLALACSPKRRIGAKVHSGIGTAPAGQQKGAVVGNRSQNIGDIVPAGRRIGAAAGPWHLPGSLVLLMESLLDGKTDGVAGHRSRAGGLFWSQSSGRPALR